MKAATIDDLAQQIQAMIDRDEWEAIDRNVARLEQLEDARRPVPQLGPSALWYAAQGIPVFPLRPGLKTPATSHGVKDATTDQSVVRGWWRATPAANIGLACGHRFDVFDIDGPEGERSWWTLRDLPPIIGRVATPRPGGSHVYVRPIGLGNSAGVLGPGIDTRGVGGYVVAPPSVLGEGLPGVKHAGRYVWRVPLKVGDPA